MALRERWSQGLPLRLPGTHGLSSQASGIECAAFVIFVRPCLSIGGDRGYDEARVYLLQAGVIKTEVGHQLGQVILHKDVSVFEQLFQYFLSCLRFDIKSDAQLIGIQIQKKPALLRVRLIVEERAMPP
jgi:hypothetical protein